MKKIRQFALLAALIIPAAFMAQVQKYYKWTGTYDHGAFNECLSRVTAAGTIHYACGGALDAANVQTAAVLQSCDAALNPLNTTMYPAPIGSPTMVAVSMCDATAYGRFGILCNVTTAAGVTSMVVLWTDYNGVLFNTWDLGPGTGTSIAFDLNGKALAVLGNVGAGIGTNFEITKIDLTAMAIAWEMQYDGCGNQDLSGGIMVDVTDYVAFGTSITAAGARDLMIVKTTNMNVWTYTQVFGSPNLDETGTDICVYTDLAGAKQYGYCGFVTPAAPALLCGTIAPGGGVYTYRYLNGINVIGGTSNGYGITYSAGIGQLLVSGRHTAAGNVNGITVGFNCNPTLTAAALNITDNPAIANNEELRDATRWNAGSPDVLHCGYQFHNSVWAANNYAWMMTSTSAGASGCPVSYLFNTLLMNSVLNNCLAPAASSHAGATVIVANNPTATWQNNCVTPFRLAAPQVAAGFQVYPNPASDLLTVEAAIGSTDVLELVMFDLTGREIARIHIPSGSESKQIPISSYADGVYVYHLELNGSIVKTEKLVIAH